MNENIYPPINFTLSKRGRPLKYTPEQVLEKFQEYVAWAKENPIRIRTTVQSYTTEGKSYGSDTIQEKPRLISIGGFLVHLGQIQQWWDKLDDNKRGEEFLVVKAFIRGYCEDYQKEMASNSVFNANIVSRLLGLVDKKQVEGGTSPINVTLTDPAAASGLKHALETGAQPCKPKNEE